MAALSRNSSGPVLRSPSPAGRFSSPASSTSTLSSRFHCGSSVRFSLDRSVVAPNRSVSGAGNGTGEAVKRKSHQQQKRTCMCSPTNHPGSFRCSLHKSSGSRTAAAPYPANRLNAQRSAMANSLVKLGTVEGDLLKRAVAALIRPSSHQLRRRGDFQPRASRLAAMSKAEGDS